MINKFKVLVGNEWIEFSLHNAPKLKTDAIIIHSLGIFDKNENEIYEGDFEINTLTSYRANGEEKESKLIEIYTRRGIIELREIYRGEFSKRNFKEIIESNVKEFVKIKGNIFTDFDKVEKHLRLLDKQDLMNFVLDR